MVILITIHRRQNIYLRRCMDVKPRNTLHAYRGFGGNLCPHIQVSVRQYQNKYKHSIVCF